MVGRWRWLAVVVAAGSLGPGPAGASGVEPFFSEYLEGAGASKALEVFNPGGAALDLEGYDVQMFFNGSHAAGLTIPLVGEIGPRDVHVMVQVSSAPEVLAAADQTAGGFWFNGDDAVVLRHDGAIVDAIGQVGVDPGVEWGVGQVSTADATLRRSPGVSSGDAVADDPFDPAAGWEGHPADAVDDLGSHTADGPYVAEAAGDVAGVEGSPVMASGAFAHPGQGSLALVCACPFGGISDLGGGAWSFSGVPAEGPAEVAIAVTASDAAGRTAMDRFTVDVENAPPAVGPIEGLDQAISTGTPVSATAPFTDPGVSDTHGATWSWGDGTDGPATMEPSGTASGAHTYSEAGLHEVSVIVRDDDGAEGGATHRHAVVFDPDAGSLGGDGAFAGSSEPGASEARILVEAAYRTKDAVTGGILFQAGDLRVVAADLHWLVVTGHRAYLTGTGVVAGQGAADVFVAVSDGARVPGGDADRVRVRIRAAGEVLFDTQPGEADDAAPRTHLLAGDLRIRPCSGLGGCSGPGGATMRRTLPAPHGGPCRPQEEACGNTRSWSSSTPTPRTRR